MDFAHEYLKVIRERFQSVKELGDKTLEQLTNEDIHWCLNNTSNNIAIIVKHLSGNMVSRWTDFLTTDGEKENRNRDAEFVDDIKSKQQLLTIWDKGWQTLFTTLNELETEDLLKNVTIRGEKHTVVEAIERQLAHYAYHVGQIVFVGKLIKDEKWKTLSIPIGKSEQYLQQKLDKNHH